MSADGSTDKRKQSRYFPEEMLREIQEEAARQLSASAPSAHLLGRPIGWSLSIGEVWMSASYSELKVRTHVIGIERLEQHRWRVSVDGRRLFTFCSEARARNAGRLEARRLDFVAQDRADLRGTPLR